MFFNWVIIGDPLFWFKNQFPSAGGTVTGLNALTPTLTLSPAALAKQLTTLNFELFPFAVIVTALMVGLWVRRRDAMTACLTAMLLLNAATRFLLVLQSRRVSLLQLRYNMRAMPIALVAAAWIIHSLGRRSARVAATVLAAAGLAVSIPVTWHMMDTWRYQYHERSFVVALKTGEDLEGQDRRFVLHRDQRREADGAVHHRPCAPAQRDPHR